MGSGEVLPSPAKVVNHVQFGWVCLLMKSLVNRSMLPILALFLCACYPILEDGIYIKGTFDPPDEPPHDNFEHGIGHGRGKGLPFLCRFENDALRPCLGDGVRPEQAMLPCDASGCHGDYDFFEDTVPSSRHLLGSDGPSCFTCHNQRWSARKEAQ